MSVVGFEVLTEVIMNFAILWDIAPGSPYMNQRSSETSNLLVPLLRARLISDHCAISHKTATSNISAVQLKPVLRGTMAGRGCMTYQQQTTRAVQQRWGVPAMAGTKFGRSGSELI
jgi:hypothetical protein